MTQTLKVGGKVADENKVDKDKIGGTRATVDKAHAGGQFPYAKFFLCRNCGAGCWATADTNLYVIVRCWNCGAINTI
jgi:hypothetical protein